MKKDVGPYVSLALKTIENYVRFGKIIAVPPDVPAELLTRTAGAFVSLHKHGRLRGCIGTIEPTKPNLAEEIIQNAISASTRDPRFTPVQPDELEDLECTVDTLSEPEPVDSLTQLDAKRYGVIVESRGRRGLLLPDLEGVDTPEEQISICRQKAFIGPNDEVKLYRFEVIRYH